MHEVIALKVTPSSEYWHTAFNAVVPFIKAEG